MAALTYKAALEALADRGRFGIRHLGLGRTRALLRELGDPARCAARWSRARTGRAACLPSRALTRGGRRIPGGRRPAAPRPFPAERLQIDGRPVDPVTFARLVEEILPVADQVARRHGDPTEFELLTAVCLPLVRGGASRRRARRSRDGGRLDATHAWDGGVAAITNVALDHMEQLGPTVEAIAREKKAASSNAAMSR